MRVLIKSVPGTIFVLLTLAPFILGVLQVRGSVDLSFSVVQYSLPFAQIVISIWYLSMNDYFQKEIGWQKRDAIPVVLFIVVLVSSIGFVAPSLRYYLLAVWIFGQIYAAVKLMPKIEVLFEERSRWFLVMELLGPVFGMTTLTPEVQRWEKRKNGEF
jgi:hypothetical protein